MVNGVECERELHAGGVLLTRVDVQIRELSPASLRGGYQGRKSGDGPCDQDLSAGFARIGCRENQQSFEALATGPSRGRSELSPKVAKEQSLKLGRALFGHSARRRTSPVSLGADRRNTLLTMKLGDGQARDGFCHRRQRRQNLVSKRHFYRDW